ncbi:hypothetical protein DRP04_03740 [Archaeoglobales archaeon]|nr:MAG: hypothetical protein DRP04_03740 [Archaeoglobales archaeon]
MEMKYTEDPGINKRVTEIIEELREEIVSRFHPKSIILSGSFGRGEATVFDEKGKLKFLSDCEIILIPYKWIFNRRELDEFQLYFYEKTGLKVEIWGFTQTFYLFLPFMKKNTKPTIANYELKYGSRVIYGKNYLEKIPNFKPEDIPLWEGVRLLFNRMAEALEHFSLENLTEEMIFWTDKIILACQDALLLSIHRYHPSYKKRNEIFQNVFEKHFGWLKGNFPHFLKLTVEATESKLGIKRKNRDAIKYWFEVVRASDIVFRYIVSREFGLHFEDYIEFQRKYIKYMICKKIRKSFDFLQELLYVAKVLRYKNFPFLTRIKHLNLWGHITYSLIPLCYFGTLEENKHYLKRVKEVLEELNIQNSGNNSDYHVIRTVLSMWRGLC